jgi:glycerate-2-kinase
MSTLIVSILVTAGIIAIICLTSKVRLAATAFPSSLFTLVLSDLPGSPFEAIASVPTMTSVMDIIIAIVS